jgi:hypothetical protein
MSKSSIYPQHISTRKGSYTKVWHMQSTKENLWLMELLVGDEGVEGEDRGGDEAL